MELSKHEQVTAMIYAALVARWYEPTNGIVKRGTAMIWLDEAAQAAEVFLHEMDNYERRARRKRGEE